MYVIFSNCLQSSKDAYQKEKEENIQRQLALNKQDSDEENAEQADIEGDEEE